MIIGITGYMGVGKTTAAKIFVEQGYKLVDADALGHELLKDNEVKQRLIAEFGQDILKRDLEINREKLGKLAFSKTELLQKLNKIMHKKLKDNLQKIILKNKEEKISTIVDVALLVEFNLEQDCDKIILIKADIQNVYERSTKGYEKKQILVIMNNQKLPQNPDFVVNNNQLIQEFKNQIMLIWNKIKKIKKQNK
ncbi:dephospho-CoA kinase [Candidatus Woesearchaeota archaeon]|jgi:dephospho-CoA kinase|nr:dephospho-CoA kinase [Candidatus Woesearchaeota archaeon]MBT5271904.1 dephospho-CoA kinase [Candidatus Woesearchaeota archaeon]MBT6040689.1 dephospho-CoA kinase [Candidatus Woesearchaeota archaeon]MBT6336192.1 dephospho-CoA kinase [Candidatus Woesearchaeota archaeon]MBT7928041.1 dephospho-CoA kinase [Candidatus Woesearchaeota archaeon]